MNSREKHALRQIYNLVLISPMAIIFTGLILPNLPSSPMMKDAFWSKKVLNKDKYDIVIAGDSRVYRGINPYFFDSVFYGKRSYNFGFSSAGMSEDYILKSANMLKSDGAGILILGISPNSFLPSSIKNKHYYSLISHNRKDLLIKLDLYPYLHFFDRRTISDFYKFWKREAYFESFNMESGYVSSDKLPVTPIAAVNAYKKQFQNEQPVSLKTFFKCIIGLREKGINVILVRIPIGLEMKQLEDETCSEFLDELENTCKLNGLLYYDYSAFRYQTYDGSHLSSESSGNFTRFFCTHIASILNKKY